MGKKAGKRVGERFVMLLESTLMSEAWQKLSPAAKDLYLLLKLRWNTHNNGNLSLTYKELKSRFCRSSINNGFWELQEKDWIVKVRPGGLEKQCSLYGLTGTHDRQVGESEYRNETPLMRRVKPIADRQRRKQILRNLRQKKGKQEAEVKANG